MQIIKKLLPEFNQIEQMANNHPGLVRLKKLASINDNNAEYPIYGLEIGTEDRTVPTLGIIGGVHGLERVGTQVLLSYLYTLNQKLSWDSDLKSELSNRRIVCIPILNPWGMAHFRRSNLNGVDLMRNSPVESDNATFLVGGHRISNKLPWYRGPEGASMEVESQVLIDFLKNEIFPSEASIVLDLHSGFGVKDQIWYPFAKSKEPFPFLNQFKNLSRLLGSTYPHHVYKIEPQSLNYQTHGDLWDYALELQQLSSYKNNIFLPLTLELGSWSWVKKNPIQIFSMFGLFNPIKQHRYSRTMRRHVYLIDFLLRATKNHKAWTAQESTLDGAP